MTRGLLARCGPLSLLLGSFVVTAGSFAIRDLTGALVACAAMTATLLALVGRSGFPLVRLVPVGIGLASIVWSNWLLSADRDWAVGWEAGLRVAFFVVPGVVFASYLDPFTVGDHLGQRLRLPARPVLAFVAALQRLEDLGATWADEARVRRVRGLAAGRSPLSRGRVFAAMMFALLVGAIRSAGRLTVAMEARGYSAEHGGGRPRTWAEPAPWTRGDSALVVICVLLALVPAMAPLVTSGR